MKQLLNNTARRRIELLELLYTSSRWLSFNELSNQLNSSIKVLREDVVYLNNPPYNKYFYIDISDKGVSILFKDNSGTDKVAELILKDAIIFDILEYLYYNNGTTLEALATQFHLSTSTVHRELKSLRVLLADKYNLQVTFKPIRLTGDESMIRSFYLQFFSERYSPFSWPFKYIDEKELEDLLKVFINLTGRPIESAMFRNIKLSAAISFQRYKQGFRITNYTTNIDDLIAKLPDTHMLHQSFNLKPKPELLNEIFHQYITENFFLSYNDFLEAATHNNQITHSYISLTYILDHLSQKFNLPISNKEDLIYHLHSTAVLNAQEINAMYLIYDTKSSIHKFVKTYHPDFYKEARLLIKDYLSRIHNNDTSINLNHLLYTLFSHWKSLFIELHRKLCKFKVIIISSNDNYHSLMIKDILNLHLNEYSLETSVFTMEVIDIKALTKLECDVIVANFTLPDIEGKKCFYVNDMPSYKDIQKIRRYLNLQRIK